LATALAARRLGPAMIRSAVDGLKGDVARLEKLLPEDHLVLVALRFELVRMLLDLGEEPQADVLFARVVTDVRKTVGLAHPTALLKREKFLPTPGSLAELFETAEQLGTPAGTRELRAAARELFAALRPLVGKVFGPRSAAMALLLIAEGRQLHEAGDYRAAAE